MVTGLRDIKSSKTLQTKLTKVLLAELQVLWGGRKRFDLPGS